MVIIFIINKKKNRKSFKLNIYVKMFNFVTLRTTCTNNSFKHVEIRNAKIPTL